MKLIAIGLLACIASTCPTKIQMCAQQGGTVWYGENKCTCELERKVIFAWTCRKS